MERIEIKIKGQVDRSWSDWLGNLKIDHTDNGNTLLSGIVRDQSALYGLLFQLSLLGIQLIYISSELIHNGGKGEEVYM